MRSLGAAAAAVILMLSILGSALGTQVDLSRAGSLTLTLQAGNEDGKLLKEYSFRLYRVADVRLSNGNLEYGFCPEFADCGISLDNLGADGLGDHLLAYALEKAIPALAEESEKNGAVTFPSLTAGLYLVSQGDAAEDYYPAAPFLISIPMTSSDDSGWVYDVQANPKAEPLPVDPSKTRVKVQKVWDDPTGTCQGPVTVALLRNNKVYDTVTLSEENNWRYAWRELNAAYRWSVAELNVPNRCDVSYQTQDGVVIITNRVGANATKLTVKKYWNSGGSYPSSVKVQLLRDKKAVDTVTLSAQNNWEYTWYNLSVNSSWDVQEAQIPNGFLPTYRTFGNTVFITNTVKLPQTGQLQWPIPVLAVSGMALALLGWALCTDRRKDKR